MKKLSKIVSLLALAGLCLFACKHPADGGISDGGGTEIPSETTKPDTGGTGGSGTSGTETESGVENLPGTAGGSSNVKDIFAGKTFYNKADESAANEKYVFGTDGTYTEFDKSDSGKFDDIYREYKYSLSDDGKFYAAVNKISFDTSSTTKKLMTYQEIKDFMNSPETKESVKQEWDLLPEEQKAEVLKAAGLQETATFEDFWNVGIEKSLEEYKEKFFVINVYDITEKTDDGSNSYTHLSGTVDSSSTDLSKMMFSGYFYGFISGSEVSIYRDHTARVQNSSKTYWTTEIDSSKLYFKEEKGTETFEATYSVAGSGKDTEITVELPEDKGGSVTLKFSPSEWKLYAPKSSESGGTETPSDPVTTYTVKFDANGGTGTMSDVTLDSQTYTLPAEAEGISAPEEKTFGGWATSKDGTAISEKTITLTESETTLYAVWKDTLYTVSLDSFNTEKKVSVIKAVKEILGSGLKDAKELVDGTLPVVLKSGVTKTEAETIVAKITEAGGTASYKKE